MNPIFKTARVSMFALPFAIVGGVATAGGLADPIPTPAPVPAPAPAPAPVVAGEWTGFYGGAQLGYAEIDPDGADEIDGVTFGLHGGYLYDFGNWVLGAEVQIDGTDIDEDDIEVDTIARGLVRLGYDAGDWLPYVTAGIARADISVAGDDLDDTGAVGGVGVEYRIAPNIRLGAEVLQHEFDDFDEIDEDIDATSGSLRVTYQF